MKKREKINFLLEKIKNEENGEINLSWQHSLSFEDWKQLLPSLNSTCLRTTGSYFLTDIFSVMVRVFFFGGTLPPSMKLAMGVRVARQLRIPYALAHFERLAKAAGPADDPRTEMAIRYALDLTRDIFERPEDLAFISSALEAPHLDRARRQEVPRAIERRSGPRSPGRRPSPRRPRHSREGLPVEPPEAHLSAVSGPTAGYLKHRTFLLL